MFEADLFVRDIENVTTCTALYLRRKTWAWDILSFPKALGAWVYRFCWLKQKLKLNHESWSGVNPHFT